MSSDKQIEELSKDIFEHCSAGLFEDEAKEIARFVIEGQGYRKSTDLAREIFEEIEEAIMQSNEISDIRMRELAPHTYKVMREAGKLYYTAILRAVAELKKKYIESEKDSG